jgi:CNT family concentrative nucleoside transporter
MWLLNVPSDEILLAGGLFGEKIILNEFVAYANMSSLQADMSPQTIIVLTFALCGFANLSSIGIMLGGLGALIPDRMGDIAKLGLWAVLAASLANLMSAALAGILFGLSGGIA